MLMARTNWKLAIKPYYFQLYPLLNRDCRIDTSDSNIVATVFTTLKNARQIFEHSEIEKNTLIGFDLQQLIFKKFEQK